jgi:hypothetical protein
MSRDRVGQGFISVNKVNGTEARNKKAEHREASGLGTVTQ